MAVIWPSLPVAVLLLGLLGGRSLGFSQQSREDALEGSFNSVSVDYFIFDPCKQMLILTVASACSCQGLGSPNSESIT